MAQSPGLGTSWVKDEWDLAKNAFCEIIDGLNRMIRDYNLEIPHVRLKHFILNEEREIENIQKEFGI